MKTLSLIILGVLSFSCSVHVRDEAPIENTYKLADIVDEPVDMKRMETNENERLINSETAQETNLLGRDIAEDDHSASSLYLTNIINEKRITRGLPPLTLEESNRALDAFLALNVDSLISQCSEGKALICEVLEAKTTSPELDNKGFPPPLNQPNESTEALKTDYVEALIRENQLREMMLIAYERYSSAKEEGDFEAADEFLNQHDSIMAEWKVWKKKREKLEEDMFF